MRGLGGALGGGLGGHPGNGFQSLPVQRLSQRLRVLPGQACTERCWARQPIRTCMQMPHSWLPACCEDVTQSDQSEDLTTHYCSRLTRNGS